MKIGFIGLGNMGLPMYMNLLKAGHNVYGFDIIKKNLPELKIVDKLTSAIEDMDVVITMLPDSKSLKSVVPEIIKTIEKRKIFIDCSTVDIETTKFIAEKGSITLNGTSLTVNNVDASSFDINFIPHTKDNTTWQKMRIGEKVNIEIDILARYVDRILGSGK